MSDNWQRGHPTPRLPREFLVSVEVYVSTTASAALRKVSTEFHGTERNKSLIPATESAQESR